MKLMEFIYKESPRKLIVLNHDDTYVEGIDLSKATVEEAAAITKLFSDMDENLKPYLKYYRKFIRKEMAD